jgi:hypothetical protein
MAVVRRGTTRLKAAELFGTVSKGGNSLLDHRSDDSINSIFRRAPGDAVSGKGHPRSLKEALEMPFPGFDVDLDELIGSRDEPSLPPPIDFSAPEYRE